MSFDLEKELKKLEKKVANFNRMENLPADLIDIVTRTAMMQLESRARVKVTLPEKVAPPEARAQGAALVVRSDFMLDKAETAALFGKLMAMLQSVGGALGAGAKILLQEMKDGNFSIEAACNAYLTDNADFFEAWKEKTPDTPGIVSFLALGSITPSIMAQADLLAAHRGPDETWNHGHCPICGSNPLIGHIVSKEGHLARTCSFCRHQYKAKRLQCPFCLEEDSEKLEYFTTEIEPGYEAHVCHTCNNYTKIADFRALDRVSIPVLDDLESLVLDILATREGFTRPTASAWGF